MDDLNREDLLGRLETYKKELISSGFWNDSDIPFFEQMRKLISMSGVLQIKTLNQILMAINNLPKKFQEEFYKICASKI